VTQPAEINIRRDQRGCAEVGTEPYLAHSCRDVDEAVRWVEYTNYGGETAYTRKRGREPYGVKY
jgi:alpha-N-arabinofuranosidase